MCGIVGLIDFGKRRAPTERDAILRDMATLIAHRGPDGEGFWADDERGVLLGQRRLAIQDLSAAGAQPMVSASGRFVVTYNGELYGFAHLRAQLAARGIAFRGHSDTEVMLEAFEAFGIAPTLKQLNGIYAFALWDRQSEVLHLARDPLGIKPLAIARHQGLFAFASEISAFDALPDFDPPIDRTALSQMLRYGCVPAPRTILEGVEKVPAGVIVSIRPDGEEAHERYFDLAETFKASEHAPITDPVEATRLLEHQLADVVESQMISDVPLGAFLSGGIDSSTIVAMMGARLGRNVSTFSIGFEDARFDESGHARAVAAHLGTRHEELILTPDAAALRAGEIVGRFDEPFADSSQIPTLLVSEMARRHVTVVLSGDGGDELFAGYTRHRTIPKIAEVSGFVPGGIRRAIGGSLASFRPEHVEAFAARMPKAAQLRLIADKTRKLGAAFAAEGLAGQYDQVTAQWPPDHTAVPGVRAETAWHVPEDEDPVVALQRADMAGYMADDILVKVDRASMAVSLEARVPFLDPRMISFAARLPTDMKIKGNLGKVILRDVLARHIPRALFERPKAGFAVPIGEWLRGSLKPMADELLSAQALESAGLDPAIVGPVWAKHLAGPQDLSRMIWPVVALGLWQRARTQRIAALKRRRRAAVPAGRR